MKTKCLIITLKLLALSVFLMVFNTGCEKDQINKNNEDGINFVDFFELAKGDTIPKGVFRNKPNVSPNDEITVLFSSEDYSLRATGNSSGSGYIYNLMTSVRDNNTASPEMLGYTKIPVDLNEGAGGYWIYLYYKKTLVEGLALTYLKVLNNCCAQILSVSQPYMEKQGMRFNPGGLWTDLNNGAGGHYIKIEGCREESVTSYINNHGPIWTPPDYFTPIKDILIISSTHSLSAYEDWTLIPTDLNKGAGGKWIYLCYKK